MAWFCSKYFVPLAVLFFLPFCLARTYKDFKKVSGTVGHKKLSALYLATSDEDRQLGLMHVTKFGPNEGVLFIFEKPQILNFWMKNTFVPLSIGFFDEEGCLREVFDMAPVKSVLDKEIPHYQSLREAQYALEVPRGWFGKKQEGVLQIKVPPDYATGLSPLQKQALLRLTHPSKCPARAKKKRN